MEKNMSVNAIMAVENNLGIGFDNRLPWPHNKKDMNWFKTSTTGHVIIMGRKTWESFGSKSLPNRKNVVATNGYVDGDPDMIVRGDIADIINEVQNKYTGLDIFIIGGANLYRQALPHCDKLYITRVKGTYKCDTFMYNSDIKIFDTTDYIDDDENMTIQIRSKK